MLNKNHQKNQVVGVYKQFNQKLRSYSIYSDSLQPISWRYFSPSLALIEWVCNPSNRTPVALRIITTHKPYIKLFFPVFLPLYVKQKNHRKIQVVGVSTQLLGIACLIQYIRHTPTNWLDFYVMFDA